MYFCLVSYFIFNMAHKVFFSLIIAILFIIIIFFKVSKFEVNHSRNIYNPDWECFYNYTKRPLTY